MNIFYLTFIDLEAEDASTRHTFEICENLQRFSHKVTLFAPDIGRLKRKTEIRIVRVWMPKIPIVGFLLYYLFLLPIIFFFSFRFKPELIYSRYYPLEIIVTYFLKRIFRLKYIVEVNGAYMEEMKLAGKSKWKIKFFTLFEHLLFRLPDRIITVTSKIKEYLIRKYKLNPNKIEVISNGTNVGIFRPMSMTKCKEMLNLNNEMRYICYVGSLQQPWHGIEYGIRAMSKILSKIGNVKLLIVGDGALRKSLQMKARELSLEKKVIFTGKVPFERVPFYINASEVCIAPFIKDIHEISGFSPLKLFDYMACGKPIVTVVMGELKEFIGKYNIGLVVSPENADELAKAIIRLINDRNLQQIFGKNGRKVAVEEFSWPGIARKVEKVCLKTIEMVNWK